jgi:hypothetical protein
MRQYKGVRLKEKGAVRHWGAPNHKYIKVLGKMGTPVKWFISFSFLCCIGIRYYLRGDPKLAIEIISLGFFAAAGAISGGFEYAKDWLGRTGNGRLFHPIHLLLLIIWPAAGIALAAGGGAARRGAEIGVAWLANLADAPMKICYSPVLTILWPGEYAGWDAVRFGVVVGALLSFVFLFRVSLADIQRRESGLAGAIYYVDFIASAFFAAYGIEAGMKFISALPIGVATHFASLACSAAVIIPSSILFGCGGGLLKGLSIDLILVRPGRILATACRWCNPLHFLIFASISVVGFIFYELLARPPWQLGTCIMLDDQSMFWTLIMCASVAVAAVWGLTTGLEDGLPPAGRSDATLA